MLLSAPYGLYLIFLSICALFLAKKEGFRPNRFIGVFLLLFLILSRAALYYLFPGALSPPVFFCWCMLGYIDCAFWGSMIMGYIAARHKPPYDRDFLIILGCSISKKGHLLPILKARTNKAIHFAWEQEIATGKPALYVPSGGQGKDEIMSEGGAMGFYLLSHGAEYEEVYPEKKSTNTRENLTFSKTIIDGLRPNAKLAFVTSDFHVLRGGMLCIKSDIEAEGLGSPTKWYFWPNAFAREFIGIMAINVRTHIVIAALAIIASYLLRFKF
ncbi:MAG: YdcF family protein [Lachnospiraceae bacterium]|nr:YdcF family protein [Lachnospiraceae bacterium]